MAPRATAETGETTADRVKQASVELMFQRGYHGTSLREVAKGVGVQMSTLYYYYPSKQAILVDLMTRTIDDLTAVVSEEMSSETDPTQRLIAGIRAHVMFHAERRMEIFITDSELRSLEPDERIGIVKKRDAYSSLFQSALRDGIESGSFDVASPSVALSSLFGMINAVPVWYRPSGPLKLTVIADQIASIFLTGIVSSSGASSLEDASAQSLV